jgi:hypothetical protein
MKGNPMSKTTHIMNLVRNCGFKPNFCERNLNDDSHTVYLMAGHGLSDRDVHRRFRRTRFVVIDHGYDEIDGYFIMLQERERDEPAKA